MVIYKISLVLHIVSGFLALSCGTFAVIARKGSPSHIRSGRIFYYSMLLVSVSALLLSGYKQNLFLFCIGIFSFYQNYAGARAVRNKSLLPSLADYAVLTA